MAVKWKERSRFRPAVIVARINSTRTISPTGEASYSGFDFDECLSVLHSMLVFPPAAAEVDASTLVWRGLAKVGKDLTPETFLSAVNRELRDRLATKENSYHLLTSLSVDPAGLPKRSHVLGADIQLLAGGYPARYKSHQAMLDKAKLPMSPIPESYCKAIVRIKAKSPPAAFHKAARALDLQRGLWCLMSNPRLLMTFGGAPPKPINVVRSGGRHTLHYKDGTSAYDGFWYEAGFVQASPYKIEKPAIATKNSRWALQRLARSKYGNRIVDSLVRFVRAFDESDPNTAFIRLWGALEGLATPGQADYGKLVQRCSFLFQDIEYHRQVLEHLREYRNTSLHAGEELEGARTHCFQLQVYFSNLVWFHLRHATFFTTLAEANEFLESPSHPSDIKRRHELVRKALRFRTSTID